MVDGAVGFHRPDNVRRLSVEKNNHIVNAIKKTRTEITNPNLYQEQQDRMAEITREKKEERRRMEKEKKAEVARRKAEREERSYDRIMKEENMVSNAGK